MSTFVVAVVLILSMLVMVPVFIIGIIADAINRWYKERDSE